MNNDPKNISEDIKNIAKTLGSFRDEFRKNGFTNSEAAALCNTILNKTIENLYKK